MQPHNNRHTHSQQGFPHQSNQQQYGPGGDKKIRNVFITGMPGTGKSTFAASYADLTNREFIDFDSLLERELGSSIRDFWEKRGERAFRAAELRFLRRQSRRQNCVIALGGGTLSDIHGVHFVREMGILVHLKNDLSVIAKRCFEQKDDRPLFSQCTNLQQAEQKVKSLWEARCKTYELSDYTLNGYYASLDNLKIELDRFEVKAIRLSYQRDVGFALDEEPQKFFWYGNYLVPRKPARFPFRKKLGEDFHQKDNRQNYSDSETSE